MATQAAQSLEDKKSYRWLLATWKVVMEKNKIKLCHAYYDSKIPFDIMNAEDQKMILNK